MVKIHESVGTDGTTESHEISPYLLALVFPFVIAVFGYVIYMFKVQVLEKGDPTKLSKRLAGGSKKDKKKRR